ncbi:MAG: UDP-N-acetylmuramate--L-alanine ligase [Fidelibacterota bacterium]
MDLTNYLAKAGLSKQKHSIKKIFFFRICGTGMGTAAIMLKNAGFHVEGYDREYSPPMSTYLKSTKIPLHKDISQELLTQFDLVVTGNVVRKDSEDAHFIERSGVKFASFPATLGALVLDNLEVIGIAGTHGKTTTTWLATQIYENLGEDPGYFIGGVLEGRDSGKIGSGKFFIESDEYDCAYFEKVSKFQKYAIDHLLLTSLEFDHADIFNSLDDIVDEFKLLLPTVNGKLIANNEYPAIEQLKKMKITKARWFFYGPQSSAGPEILNSNISGTKFKLTLDKDYRFKTNLTGYHNILNLSAVLIFALQDGHQPEQLNRAIANLKMVKRRQEYLGTYNGSIVIDDFAHHPRAVSLTIDAIKEKYPGKEVITFLEPRSATARSDIFQQEFTEALKKSDQVVLIQPISTTVKFAKDLDTRKMASELNEQNIPTIIVTKLTQLEAALIEYATPNRLILFLSNSTCLGLWKSDFMQKIKQ